MSGRGVTRERDAATARQEYVAYLSVGVLGYLVVVLVVVILAVIPTGAPLGLVVLWCSTPW